MGTVIYNIFLVLYSTAIRIASFFNKKAALWVQGRKQWQLKLQKKLDEMEPGNNWIWFHCASLGEFEQGRPVLEKMKDTFPDYKILLTFFSPSGYEIRKNYPKADMVMYLPMDDFIASKKFIRLLKPSLVIWVKYDYWYYYLTELKKMNIPVILVSGIFREGQPFFKWYGAIWKKMLETFTHIFVQNDYSAALLKAIGIQGNVTVAGDTRYDRVIDIAENFEPLPKAVLDFCNGHHTIVAGSTWEEDNALFTHFSRENNHLRFIIAPHETDKAAIEDAKKHYHSPILFSDLINNESLAKQSNVLIIDNIGMLSRLYKIATIAYVGGGFNDSGIHNTLEAAVHGKPVIFGPVYEKFAEANGLIEKNAAYSISNALELEQALNKLLLDTQFLETAGCAAKEFVYSNRGATETIINYLCEKRLLTN